MIQLTLLQRIMAESAGLTAISTALVPNVLTPHAPDPPDGAGIDADEEAWRMGVQAEAEAQPLGSALIDAGLRLYSMLDGEWHNVYVEAYNERSSRHRVRCEPSTILNREVSASHDHDHCCPIMLSHHALALLPISSADSDGTQMWHLLRDERWLQTSKPEDRPLTTARAGAGGSERRRPSRAAGEVASRAAARLSAQEENGRDQDDDGGDDVLVPSDDDDDHGDQDHDVDGEAPPRKRARKGARRPHAKKASEGGTGAATSSAGRTASLSASDGAHPRPPGRAPVGKQWDSQLGQWVAREPAVEPPTHPAAGTAQDYVGIATGAAAGTMGGEVLMVGGTSAGAVYPMILPPEGARTSAASRWEAAGADLPGWMVERRVAATGRQYAVYHGPQGHRATSRTQALTGGVRRGTLQKPMEEMTMRELICERTQGVPMRAARVVRMRRRKGADDAPGADGGGPTADGEAPVGGSGSAFGWSDFSLGGGGGRSFVITNDAEEAEEFRRQRDAEEEEARGPQLASKEAGEEGEEEDEERDAVTGAAVAADGPRGRLRRRGGGAWQGDEEDRPHVRDGVEERNGEDGEEGEEGEDEDEDEDEDFEEEGAAEGANGPGFVPQLRIVNGQIVLDEASLHVSARPSVTNLAPTIEVDTGAGVTSASYLNRAQSLPWSPQETGKFLAALQKYGTDFSLIAALFPKRNRRQIKNKFKREEREDPRRMDLLLSAGRCTESELPDRAQMQSLIERCANGGSSAVSEAAVAPSAAPASHGMSAAAVSSAGASAPALAEAMGAGGREHLRAPAPALPLASSLAPSRAAPPSSLPPRVGGVGSGFRPVSAAAPGPPASPAAPDRPHMPVGTSVPPVAAARGRDHPIATPTATPTALAGAAAGAPREQAASGGAAVAAPVTQAATVPAAARAAPLAATRPAIPARRPMLSSTMMMSSKRTDVEEQPLDKDLPPEPEEWLNEQRGGGSEDEDEY